MAPETVSLSPKNLPQKFFTLPCIFLALACAFIRGETVARAQLPSGAAGKSARDSRPANASRTRAAAPGSPEFSCINRASDSLDVHMLGPKAKWDFRLDAKGQPSRYCVFPAWDTTEKRAVCYNLDAGTGELQPVLLLEDLNYENMVDAQQIVVLNAFRVWTTTEPEESVNVDPESKEVWACVPRNRPPAPPPPPPAW